MAKASELMAELMRIFSSACGKREEEFDKILESLDWIYSKILPEWDEEDENRWADADAMLDALNARDAKELLKIAAIEVRGLAEEILCPPGAMAPRREKMAGIEAEIEEFIKNLD